MEIEYSVQIWKEDGHFIAHAMPLDVASSGLTLESARRALEEAVRLFLDTAAEHGSLKEVLEEAGYVNESGQWRSPAWVAVERCCAAVGS